MGLRPRPHGLSAAQYVPYNLAWRDSPSTIIKKSTTKSVIDYQLLS